MPKKTLVLLHGFTGAPFSWDAVRDAAADEDLWMGCQVLTPWLCGHGVPPAATEATWQENIHLLAKDISESAHGPLVLASYSMGGRVALGLLAHFGARVCGMMLIGAHLGLPKDDPTARDARLAWCQGWQSRLRDEPFAEVMDAWQSQDIFRHQESLASTILATQRQIRLEHDPAFLAKALGALDLAQMPDYRPLLTKRLADGLPLILAYGDGDHKYGQLFEDFAKAGRAVSLRVQACPQSGHNVLLHNPRWVARKIHEVIAETNAPPHQSRTQGR